MDIADWKKLKYNERCAIYRERDKTKLCFKKNSAAFATNNPNTLTKIDARKMLETPNAAGNALGFAKWKLL